MKSQSSQPAIRQVRETKHLNALSVANTDNLKTILGEPLYEALHKDAEALGMLFNLYDVHNEYFRGYTVNMMQMAIESHNRLCIVVLEGMRDAFDQADIIINQSVESQQAKVENRKRLLKLAVHLAVSIPLSIAGIPANALIEQLTNTTGASSFGNVPTVSGNKLTFDWASDVDIWQTAKEEYAGAFLKGVVGEVQGQVTNLAKELLFKLTGEGVLKTMAESASASRQVFDRLTFEVKRHNNRLKRELVERLEDKSTRTQFKTFVVDDLRYLLVETLGLSAPKDVAKLKSNYYLAQAWIRRVMRSRSKLLRTTLLRQVNIDEASQETYVKVLAKLSVLYWLGGTKLETMNAPLCDGLVGLDLLAGFHDMDYSKIKHPRYSTGYVVTKGDLRQWRTRQRWHDDKIMSIANYNRLGYKARNRLHNLITNPNKQAIAEGVTHALTLVADGSGLDVVDIDNALSLLGVVKYTDSKEKIKTGLFGTPSKATRQGVPSAVAQKEAQSLIYRGISNLLRLWLEGSSQPVNAPTINRSSKPSRIPFMKALVGESPSVVYDSNSYFGYTEIDTVANGNCFFDAVIKSVAAQFPDEPLGKDIAGLRNDCAEEFSKYVKTNSADCLGFGLDIGKKAVSTAVNLIKADTEWDFHAFDLVVGSIMPRVIGRQIVTILSGNGSQWITGVTIDHDRGLPPVYLCYNGVDHYIGLRPPEQEELDEFHDCLDFSDFEEDESIPSVPTNKLSGNPLNLGNK